MNGYNFLGLGKKSEQEFALNLNLMKRLVTLGEQYYNG
jgi:hypothetical protein